MSGLFINNTNSYGVKCLIIVSEILYYQNLRDILLTIIAIRRIVCKQSLLNVLKYNIA